MKEPYPKGVYFILSSLACERFVFFAVQTLLSIYLINELLFTEGKTTAIYHIWKLLSNLTPILGAMLGDSKFGKFRTIFYMSLLYFAGNIVLTAGSVKKDLTVMRHLSIWGMMAVACFAGIIKPCVLAFGGDQFNEKQEKQRDKFFTYYYYMISFGSLLSFLLAPPLRKHVKCMGGESCYPLAYGVPAAALLVSLIILTFGRSLYKNINPEQNVLFLFPGCIAHAILQRMKAKKKIKDHWLDYAEGKYEKKFIEDAKYVFNVWFVTMPLPIFYALYEQQGSSWTIQASKLDGKISGIEILPDQMIVLNSAFLLIFIPMFDLVIYPLFNKIGILTRPLQRITAGGFIGALAFLTAGILELAIERELQSPEALTHNLCYVNLTGTDGGHLAFPLKSNTQLKSSEWKLFQVDCDVMQKRLESYHVLNNIFDSEDSYSKAAIYSRHQNSTFTYLENSKDYNVDKMSNQFPTVINAFHKKIPFKDP